MLYSDDARFEKGKRFFRALTLLIGFSAVCWTMLVYPWRLPDSVLQKWEARHRGPDEQKSWLYSTQLRSQVVYTHSPLVYKESVAQGFLLGALASFFVYLFLTVLEPSHRDKKPLKARLRSLSTDPRFWSLVMLIYFLLGIHGLSFGPLKLFDASPTYHYSLRTLLAMFV